MDEDREEEEEEGIDANGEKEEKEEGYRVAGMNQDALKMSDDINCDPIPCGEGLSTAPPSISLSPPPPQLTPQKVRGVVSLPLPLYDPTTNTMMDAWTYLYATLSERPWEKKKQKKKRKKRGRVIVDENVFENEEMEGKEKEVIN